MVLREIRGVPLNLNLKVNLNVTTYSALRKLFVEGAVVCPKTVHVCSSKSLTDLKHRFHDQNRVIVQLRRLLSFGCWSENARQYIKHDLARRWWGNSPSVHNILSKSLKPVE